MQTFISQHYINYFFLVVSINYVYNGGKGSHLSIGKQITSDIIHWLLIAPRSDIAFTSCKASPNDKISRPKVKPLRINDLEQGIFFQLCCLVGSNFSNLFWTFNSIKAWKVKEGLFCCSWIKSWLKKKEKYISYYILYIIHFLNSVWWVR